MSLIRVVAGVACLGIAFALTIVGLTLVEPTLERIRR